MNDPLHTDLHTLLDHPEQVAQVPPDHRQELLDALAVHEGRCRVVRDLLTAPLAATVNGSTATTTSTSDVLLTDVQEVAALVRHSVSWVRKNGHRLPGFSQPGGRGTRVAWSRRALEAWVSGDGATLQTATLQPWDRVPR